MSELKPHLSTAPPKLTMESEKTSSTPSQIDHIVLLLSPSDFNNVPPWLANNFTIIEGGTHSKGTSHNKLIIFQDGTYLELFSWVDPAPTDVAANADFPGWRHKTVGSIIDWAVTGADAHGKFHEVITRLKDLLSNDKNLNLGYDQPVAGGRKRMDGTELRWVTTRPRRLRTSDENEDNDMSVPFFCHDISLREARVPYVEGSIDSWPGLVTHPSGVVGIAGLIISVPRSRIEAFVELYEAILGVPVETVRDWETYRFYLPSPNQMREQKSWYTQGIKYEDVSQPLGDGGDRSDTTCFVELQGVDHEHPGNSLQRLILRTSTASRKGERLDDEQLMTPVLLR